jgi:Fur family ferric uptake transcriptional regulator
MAKYTTKQRMLLLDFLSEHIDETLSAGQIAEALTGKGISASAIYRNLAALEQEGKVKRLPKPGRTETYYRYTDGEHCRGHLHLSCLCCGKTIHVEETETEALARRLAKNEGFALDREDTVLYGICADCQK